MGTWAVAKAKAQFSELIETAQEHGAQEITRNGKLVGVLVSPSDWEKKKQARAKNARTMSTFLKSSPLVGSGINLPRRGAARENLAEFFRNSPLRDLDIEFERVKFKPRHIDF